MFYANLTDDQLDFPYLQDEWDNEPRTLREALDEIGEDLLLVEFEEEDKSGIKTLIKFTAWSNDSVIFLLNTIGLGSHLYKVKRNP